MILFFILHSPFFLPGAFAQGTTFTYQGRLTEGGTNANGIFDLKFAICDSSNVPTVLGAVTNSAVPVTNGLFTVTLDFGPAAFDGSARWLDIGVRTNGSGADYATLAPRQPVTPTPYAIHARNAGMLDGVGGTNYVAKAGDTMTGTLNLPADGLVAGGNQLVLSGGKVGVGTQNPSAWLEVKNAVNNISLGIYYLSSNADEGNSIAWYSDTTGGNKQTIGMVSVVNDGANVRKGKATLALANGGLPEIVTTWTSAGNVGIGTAEPGALLTVGSSAHAPGSA